MVIFSKVYIIACLLLNLFMCQRQEYPEYPSNSLSEQSPEMAMPKRPRSGEPDGPLNSDQWQSNSIQDSQLGVGICPAENPGDLSIEKSHAHKKHPKKIVRDEDDDEDLDMAAGDDDDEDDDDELGGDDTVVDDEAFVARISCLMGALDHHAKAITGNVRNIETRLGKLRPQGASRKSSKGKEQHPKTKWSQKSQYYQEWEECPGPLRDSQESRDDSRQAWGQKLDPGQDIRTRAENSGDESLPGSEDQRWKPRHNAFESLNPSQGAQEHSHQRYAEYEDKLTRLMANRDAIERNVMKVLGPRQAERL